MDLTKFILKLDHSSSSQSHFRSKQHPHFTQPGPSLKQPHPIFPQKPIHNHVDLRINDSYQAFLSLHFDGRSPALLSCHKRLVSALETNTCVKRNSLPRMGNINHSSPPIPCFAPYKWVHRRSRLLCGFAGAKTGVR
jgi:hypothetical protein